MSAFRTATLETGNAAETGATSRGWFVGDLRAWAEARSEALELAGSLRQCAQLEVKWLVHPPGDRRTTWADRDRSITLSVLVDGEMTLDFRSDDDARSVHLARQGDYVIWHGPTFAHVWRTDTGCTIVTIRWRIEPNLE